MSARLTELLQAFDANLPLSKARTFPSTWYFDPEIFGFDLEINFLRLGQHRHGRGGGVNAALRFRCGHALYAMNAALITQLPKNRFAGNFEDHFP